MLKSIPVEALLDAPSPASEAGVVAGGWRVRVHDSLSSVETVWRDLERRGDATAFQGFDWVRLVVERLGAGRSLELLLVEVLDRSGETVMLLPLGLERHRGVRTIGCLDLDVCDYGAPLLSPDHRLAPRMVGAFWRELKAQLPKADLLRLARMPGRIGEAENPLLGLPGCRVIDTRRYGLPIAPPPHDIVRRSTRPSTFRDLGKFQRRLERRGEVAFTRASDPGEVDTIMAALVAQRRARFAQIGRENLMDRPEIADFYRAAALDGLRDGPARLFGLSVDGEWVATAYGLQHGTDFCLLIQTMAGGEWRNTSPGILVSARAMEWAVASGLTYFDFSIGFLPYKSDLGAEAGDLFEIAEPMSPLGALVLGKARLAERIKAELRRHPATFERLRTLRRALRRL